MLFRFLTLFPNLITPYFQESILKNALQKKLFDIEVLNLFDFSTHPHKKVDNTQIGGGAGQVIDLEVLGNALEPLRQKSHIIFLTPCAKPFKHNDSIRLAQKPDITFVCGRYEGFDERAIEIYADEVFSIGDFILTGGELAALALCDCIARHIDGVLGNSQSLSGESFENYLLEAPVFSKSRTFLQKNEKNLAPSEYYKGNHSIMQDLKEGLAVSKTKYFRPDLFQKWKIKNHNLNNKGKK